MLGRLGYGIWFAFYTNLKNRAWKCEASYQLKSFNVVTLNNIVYGTEAYA